MRNTAASLAVSAIMLAAAIAPARAQDSAGYFRIISPTASVITAFGPDCVLVWSNAVAGISGRVQRAATLRASNNWVDFEGFTATNDVMTLPTADYMVIDLSEGPSASSYPVTFLTGIPAGGWTEEYKTVKLVLRRIPADTFLMGSPAGELGRETDETRHQVTISRPFYVGVFEVTQRQWERVMGSWPAYFYNEAFHESRPVEQVSYGDIRGMLAGAGWPASGSVDANSFMGRLRARTGVAFDLPTEAQWEYAGRAGTATALNSGRDLTSAEDCPNMSEVGRYWYNGGSANGQLPDSGPSAGTAPAGSYLPNAWGLYDMHGNVWEFCLDWAGAYGGTQTDPKGPSTGSYRVRRGGSWSNAASDCRSALRSYLSPSDSSGRTGFRVLWIIP